MYRSVQSIICILLIKGIVPSFGFTAAPSHKNRFVSSRSNSYQKSNWNTNTNTNKHHSNNKKTMSTTSPLIAQAALAQYAGKASTLFSNMVTPASILAGALVPIAFASGLSFVPDEEGRKESKLATVLRKLFPFLSVCSFASQLVAIMWAAVAVNKLTELTDIPLAASVWDLVLRDFQLEWVAVNTHFVTGLLGFMSVVGIKTFFMANQGLSGLSAAGMAVSGMTFMVSIVNRGIALGAGPSATTPGTVQRFGTNIFSLGYTYATLFAKRSFQNFGPLELVAVTLAAVSTVTYLKFVVDEVKKVVSSDKKKAV